MAKMQLVFLFDLNAFSYPLEKSNEYVNKSILRVRLLCLRLLTDFGSKFENMKWGFKFFNSNGFFNENMEPFSFSDSSLENFEILENEINLRYKKHPSFHVASDNVSEASVSQKNSDTQKNTDISRCTPAFRLMHLALSQLLNEYQWGKVSTPETSILHDSSVAETKNFIFLISQCPSTKEHIMKYFNDVNFKFDIDGISTLILPQDLYEKMHVTANIRLIWLDTSQTAKSFPIDHNFPDVYDLMCSALKKLSCSLVPFNIWSQPCPITKIIPPCINNVNKETQSLPCLSNSHNSKLSVTLHKSSHIPLSSLLQKESSRESIDGNDCAHESVIIFPDDLQICINLHNAIKVPGIADPESIRESTNHLLNSSSSSSTCDTCRIHTNLKKCIVKNLVEGTMDCCSSENYACSPKGDSSSRNFHHFKEMMKLLIIQNKRMVMGCPIAQDFQLTVLLTPCSDVLATVTILSNDSPFIIKGISNLSNEIMDLKRKTENAQHNINIMLQNLHKRINGIAELSPDGCNRNPYQVEPSETLFRINSTFSNVATHRTNSSKKRLQAATDVLQRQLRKHYRRKLRHPQKKTTFNVTLSEALKDEQKPKGNILKKSMSFNESCLSQRGSSKCYTQNYTPMQIDEEEGNETKSCPFLLNEDPELKDNECQTQMVKEQIDDIQPSVKEYKAESQQEQPKSTFKRPNLLKMRNKSFPPLTSKGQNHFDAQLEDKPKKSQTSEAPHIECKHQNNKTIFRRCKSLNETFRHKCISLPESDLLNPSESQMTQEQESKTVPNIDCVEYLLEETTNIYDSAIQANEALIQCAKNIINKVSCFYQVKNSSAYMEEVKSFMHDNICLTARTINEKYEKSTPHSTETKIKEYQFQAVLALEQEILFPSDSQSMCVDAVTSLLRMISFLSCPAELKTFLHDVLKENYFDTLNSVLTEIGDELNIPIVPDEEDASSSEVTSSESLSDINLSNPMLSSAGMSSSSISSAKSNRTSFQNRNDIETGRERREIMIPGDMLKKNKRPKLSQSSEDISKRIKYSPSLASKKLEKENKDADHESKTVCRNLFSMEKDKSSPSAPTYNPFRRKKRHVAPKGQVLKTKYVAGTPSPKQRRFGMQRNDTAVKETSAVREIAESPKINQSIKDASNLRMLRHLQRSQSASSTAESPEVSNSRLESRRIIQYTPDSKRRLSLKLFSKLLTSPTANRGPKRCSKRLFEQTTPSCSSKRMRLSSLYQHGPPTEVKNKAEVCVTQCQQSPLTQSVKVSQSRSPLLVVAQTPTSLGGDEGSVDKRKFTPPTNFSLLHLTTSPLLNVSPRSGNSPNL